MSLNKKLLTEDQLLELAILGNADAIRHLVDTYRDIAFTVAMKILHNREDAEEVIQDAFVKAFLALGEFRKAARFSTWLYRIVYNTALTKHHAKKIPATSKEVAITGEDSLWNQLQQSERKKYVDLALQQLKPEDRLIITLHYMADKSTSEIGQIMDMKKSAVKMRLLRSRKQLETTLQKMLHHELKELL